MAESEGGASEPMLRNNQEARARARSNSLGDDEEIVDDGQRRPRSNMDGPPAPLPELEQNDIR